MQNRMVRKPNFTEWAGFKVGDVVRLTCKQVPSDAIGKITGVKLDRCSGEMAFRVNVKSAECRDANGDWYPLYVGEVEKWEMH